MSATRGRVIVAFLAVYIVWGSTYLGIKIAIETMPPLLMASARFIVAGAILYAYARRTGAPKPTRRNWGAATMVGFLLLLMGNGGVALGEVLIPSGLAALLVATEPFWIALFDWIRPGGGRPPAAVILGLLIGFVGVALLVSPGRIAGGAAVNPLAAGAVLLASLSWAAGSLYSAKSDAVPQSPVLFTGMEMLVGSVLLLVAGLLMGEGADVHLSAITARSWWALAYLIFIGALVGFSAYTYILKNASPSHVSTYAYVNPVVAVFLGWALLDEPVTPRTLLAAAIIVGAVVVITSAKSRAFSAARGALRNTARFVRGGNKAA